MSTKKYAVIETRLVLTSLFNFIFFCLVRLFVLSLLLFLILSSQLLPLSILFFLAFVLFVFGLPVPIFGFTFFVFVFPA